MGKPIDDSLPEGLDDFVASINQPAAPGHATADGVPAGLDDFIAQDFKEEKYGSLGQQTLTALEGAGVGASFGLSTGLETALGVKPEDIQARREVNPIAHGGGEAAGLVGSAFIPVAGQANVMAKAGQLGAKALVGTGGGIVKQIGSAAIKGAFEGALFQGGDEISKAFSQDPNQTAETALADIGLATVLGGAFGATLTAGGKALEAARPGKFVSQMDMPKLDAGDFATTVKLDDAIPDSKKKNIIEGLADLKPEAAEIKAAGERLGAPVMEGMTSNSKAVQMAEDGLLRGPRTYAAGKRQDMYQQGFEKAVANLDTVIGPEGQFTKAEVGQSLKQSITQDLAEQNKPISAMYDKIKQSTEYIPIERDASQAMLGNLSAIRELKIAPSSAEGQMIKRVLKEAKGLKTVDDLKAYRATLDVSPTASSGEKRMSGILKNMLSDMEEDAIERYASKVSKSSENWLFQPGEFESLKAARKEASGQYKQFIGKVETLSEQLGKGRVYGYKDAVNFINDLTPEQVTQRLFSKNNSQFLKFFEKEFPEQMNMMRAYQKSVMRETASRNGEFSPKVFLNNLNKLEPEIRQSLFSKAELSRLKDVETYLNAFPKNYNPSGTSHMSAMRDFFNPGAEDIMGIPFTGRLKAEARDAGMEAFIKGVGQVADPQMKAASMLGKATVKGWQAANKAVKAIFTAKVGIPTSIQPQEAAMTKLDKLVADNTADPSKMLDMGENNPVPEYNQAFAATSMRAVQYLSTLKPKTEPANPLDAKRIPNFVEESKYQRALGIAQQPLVTLNYLHQGQLTSQDVITLKTIYPALYGRLSQQITSQLAETLTKGEEIPYETRMGLSLFLGMNLDSSMMPQSIVAAQPLPEQQEQSKPQGGKPPAYSSVKGLDNIGKSARTPGQSSEQARVRK